MDWEGCVSPVGSWDSPSAEESESLQVSANLLSIYKHEDKEGGEGRGNSEGYAYADQLEISQIGAHR